MNTLAQMLTIAALYTFGLLPQWIAQGEVSGVNLSDRNLRLEEKTRFVRYLPSVLFGAYISSNYGMLSRHTLVVVVGGALIGSALVFALSLWSGRGLTADEARGADYRDLVGPDE